MNTPDAVQAKLVTALADIKPRKLDLPVSNRVH